MNKKERAQIEKRAADLTGRRQSRYISKPEIDKMAALDRKKTLAGKRIRVYSFDGFVPNSYKYRADIDYIERYYDPETGKKIFTVSQTGASRSHGNGSLVTVNGRAY
jgi:hypothetical protein